MEQKKGKNGFFGLIRRSFPHPNRTGIVGAFTKSCNYYLDGKLKLRFDQGFYSALL
jgi:hypothetical protein